MKIDIGIEIDGKKGGLMGVSLDEIQAKPTKITKSTKKKKKRKSKLLKAIESSIPKKSDYTTEVV